jgi:hypothetical protein
MSSFSFCVHSSGSHILRVFDPILYDCALSKITIWTKPHKAGHIGNALDEIGGLSIGNQMSVIPKRVSC